MSASRTDAETVPSEATNLSTDEGQQELPEILSAPVILVAGPSPPENEEANTDPERPRSHEPGGTEGARRGPSQSQGVQTRRSSSNSYEYDREEPLLTKRTKVYKKSTFDMFEFVENTSVLATVSWGGCEWTLAMAS